MKPPTGIERLTPAEAWQDGYRAGRESLALSYQHDKEIREAKEGRTLERLDAIEEKLGALVNNAADRALLIVRTLERVKKLEEGPKYMMTDEEVRRVAEVVSENRAICDLIAAASTPDQVETMTSLYERIRSALGPETKKEGG